MATRTQMEEVTRTYCDGCGKDITGGTRHGAGTNKPEQHWVACSGCEKTVRQIAELRYNHPDIFNNLLEVLECK